MKNITNIEPALLRCGEAAALLGVSRALAYRWAKNGVLPTIRLSGGRAVRIPRAALMAWIETNTAPGAASTARAA
jgi:excisionase family DNA binding protein